jgi:O-antigen/teichoic acid export membrane protein
MQQLVIKKVSENKSEAGKYLSNYFGIQFLLGLGFMALLWVITYTSHYPDVLKQALYVTGLALLISSLNNPFMAIINAFQRLEIIAVVNFINSMINVAMMLITIHFHKSIFFISFVNLIVGVVDFLIYRYVVEKNFTPFRLKFDFKFWKTLFIVNIPFTLLTFFSIYNRIDTLILPHLRSFTENGYYAAAYKFWDILAFVPAVVSASLLPFFAESLIRNQVNDARRGLESYTKYMIALALPFTVGAFLLSHKLIAFYGIDFAPAAQALGLLVAAVSVLCIYSPVNAMIITQRTSAAVKITGFNLLFNLILNIILIRKFGFVAAAAVTLASECVQWIGYTYVVNRHIVKFKFWGNFLKPTIAVIAMGIVVKLLIHQNIFLIVAIGGLVYFAVLFFLKFFQNEDRKLLFGGLRVNPAPIERDVL